MSNFQVAYGPTVKPKINTGKKGAAQQHYKDEVDINKIMARYQKDGAMTHFARHEGSYGEFSPIQYDEALQTVIDVRSMFDELPSKVRNRVDNDPVKFLQFVQDPANLAEMKDLGLVKDPQGAAGIVPPVAAEAVSEGAAVAADASPDVGTGEAGTAIT